MPACSDMDLARILELAREWFATSYTIPIPLLYMRVFEDDVLYNNAYVGLYTANGTRWGDRCLIVWNKFEPVSVNSGYAPGRCPEQIEIENGNVFTL